MASLEELDSALEDLRHVFGKLEKALSDADFIIRKNDLDTELRVKFLKSELRNIFTNLESEISKKRKDLLKEL